MADLNTVGGIVGKKKATGGKKGRKIGRHSRQRHSDNKTTMSSTRYRLDHGIPPGSRKKNHREGLCPVHSKRRQTNGN